VASPRARRACVILWIVPDNVGVELAAEVKPSTDYVDYLCKLCTAW
jgi:hypothetical protein